VRLLITAGPTREHLDDVRYLSNASSGRMGLAVAAAGARRGHAVTVVLGPVELAPPPGVEVVRVVSAEEMREAVARLFPACDAAVMAAAVADYAPAERIPGKRKKGAEDWVVRLRRTRDILAEAGREKGARVLVGFALEAGRPEEGARAKLREKRLDLVVLNGPENLGTERGTVALIPAAGEPERLRDLEKGEIAERIVGWIERELERRRS